MRKWGIRDAKNRAWGCTAIRGGAEFTSCPGLSVPWPLPWFLHQNTVENACHTQAWPPACELWRGRHPSAGCFLASWSWAWMGTRGGLSTCFLTERKAIWPQWEEWAAEVHWGLMESTNLITLMPPKDPHPAAHPPGLGAYPPAQLSSFVYGSQQQQPSRPPNCGVYFRVHMGTFLRALFLTPQNQQWGPSKATLPKRLEWHVDPIKEWLACWSKH